MRIPVIPCALMLASTPVWGQGLTERATAPKATAHRGTAARNLSSSSHSGGGNLLKTAGIGIVAGAALGAVIMTLGDSSYGGPWSA